MNRIKGTNVYWVELLKVYNQNEEKTNINGDAPYYSLTSMSEDNDDRSKIPTRELFVKKASIFSFKGIKMLFKICVLNKFRPDFERSYFEEAQ